MEKFVIIGDGPYAVMMKRYIDIDKRGEIVGFALEDEYIKEPFIEEIPVISLEKLQQQYMPQEIKLIMAIGYKQMGNIRKKLFEKCKELGYTFANYIHSTAVISKDVIIGEGNNILDGVVIGIGTEIGNANLFFSGCAIGHDSKIGNYNTFSVRAATAGCVEVTNNCFMGVGAVTKDHIVLNHHVLVGAGAYAFESVEAYSIVMPAKSVIVTDKKSTDYL